MGTREQRGRRDEGSGADAAPRHETRHGDRRDRLRRGQRRVCRRARARPASPPAQRRLPIPCAAPSVLWAARSSDLGSQRHRSVSSISRSCRHHASFRRWQRTDSSSRERPCCIRDTARRSVALLAQAVWAVVLTWSGTYGQLLDYTVFGDWIFFALITATIFVYRRHDTPGTCPLLSRPRIPRRAGGIHRDGRLRRPQQHSIESTQRVARVLLDLPWSSRSTRSGVQDRAAGSSAAAEGGA